MKICDILMSGYMIGAGYGVRWSWKSLGPPVDLEIMTLVTDGFDSPAAIRSLKEGWLDEEVESES